MGYTGNPSTCQIDEIRLMVGDSYSDMEILDDSTYQFLIDKYGSVSRAAIEAARMILFSLSRWTRERTGDIEVYGSEWAKSYRYALTDWLRNPTIHAFNAVPYAGGISASDMEANTDNVDNVTSFSPSELNENDDFTVVLNDF